MLCTVVLLCVACCRLAPTSEWDTAAADIIVREAGGAVLQAGKVTGKGELLEDWQVGWGVTGRREQEALDFQAVIHMV